MEDPGDNVSGAVVVAVDSFDTLWVSTPVGVRSERLGVSPC